jgi:hypothetical protein
MKKILCLAASTAFLFMSCEKETAVVDMTVGWTIGLESPTPEICLRAGIENVLVALDSAGDSFERRGGCMDGEIVFENIPQTEYTVSVSGLDPGGCPIYYGEQRVDSGGPGQVAETLRLESVPSTGSVTIAWWFEDARFCSYHAVETVRVTIFRDDVDIVDEDVGCDLGVFTIERALTGRYSIRLEALAAEGLLCSEYHDAVLEPCGAIEAEGPLEPCAS